jgi:hypothetical protein
LAPVELPRILMQISPSTSTAIMPDYVIQGCTIQDSADVARNNMSSFWQDQNWRLTWKHSTLPRVIEACTARSPRNLLKDRALLRHFKAVDPETGRFLGYARWKLPPGYQTGEDGCPTWPEGQVPDVSAEERAKIEEVADAADWKPNDEADELDAPITRRKIEYLARKEYLSELTFKPSPPRSPFLIRPSTWLTQKSLLILCPFGSARLLRGAPRASRKRCGDGPP